MKKFLYNNIFLKYAYTTIIYIITTIFYNFIDISRCIEMCHVSIRDLNMLYPIRLSFNTVFIRTRYVARKTHGIFKHTCRILTVPEYVQSIPTYYIFLLIYWTRVFDLNTYDTR